MTINIYDTRTMLAALEDIPPVNTFLLKTFFPGEKTFATKHVDIDIVKGKRRLAPFVSPRMQGKMVEKLGYTTRSYTPPYIKPKMISTAEDYLKRAAGSVIYTDGFTPTERAATTVGQELAELDEMITRREEWMAAQALFTGQVHAVGDGIDDVIDFARSADHVVTLSGTALWSDAASKPLDQLRIWRRKLVQDSGLTPDVAIFGADAIEAFLNNPDLGDKLDNRRIKVGQVEPQALPDGVTYYGHINEIGLDIYGYDEWYLDDSGTEQPMVPVDKILLGSTRARNRRLYGAIQDVEAGGLVETSRFPKSWTEKDPSSRIVMLQSAPLVALLQPDSTLVAKVV